MDKLLFIHLGEKWEIIAATSLVKRLVLDGYQVDCITNNDGMDLYKYCKGCNVSLLSEISSFKPKEYSKAINTNPGVIASSLMECIDADIKCGFGRSNGDLSYFNEGVEKFYNAIYAGKESKSNYFQLLFSLAELSWRGDGYSVGYYPKNKSKDNLTGVAIRDYNMRKLILNNLKLDHSRLWVIPFKNNICKMFDEVNRCKRIVTDDLSILHSACALRKKVEFITRKNINYKLEMFNSGSIHFYGEEIA